MGLLDGLTDDPTMSFAMGLLNASGPSARPVSLGQGIAQGYGAMSEAKQNQLKNKQAQQAILFQQMQMDKLKSDLAIEDAQANAWKSAMNPQQAAPVSAPPTSSMFGGGTAVEASNAQVPTWAQQSVPQTAPATPRGQPKLSDVYLAAAQAATDPRASMKLYQQGMAALAEEKKLAPKFANDVRTVMINGVPTAIQMADDGTWKKMGDGVAPAEKLSFHNVGNRTVGLDAYTGAEKSGIKNTMSPDAAASNDLGWANYAKPQFHDGSFVYAPTKAAPNGTAVAVPGLTPKAPEAYLKQVAGIQSTMSAADSYIDQLKNWKASSAISPTARASMGTAYQNLLLQAKEAYNLGVLNGPDQDILKGIINSPLDVSTTVVPTAAMIKQASDLKTLLNKTHQAIAKVYNQPVPKDLPSQESKGNIGDKKSSMSSNGWSATVVR